MWTEIEKEIIRKVEFEMHSLMKEMIHNNFREAAKSYHSLGEAVLEWARYQTEK